MGLLTGSSCTRARRALAHAEMPLLLAPTYRIEGPPPGVAQGRWDLPFWLIAILGGALVTLGLVYFVVRLVQLRRSAS